MKIIMFILDGFKQIFFAALKLEKHNVYNTHFNNYSSRL